MGVGGLTALNLAIPVYSFIHGAVLMLGVGGAVGFTLQKSGREFKNCNLIFTNTAYLGIFFSAVFMLTGGFLSKKLSILLGADESVLSMTNAYLKILLLFSPAFIFNDILSCYIRNDGCPNLSMFAMIVGSLSNVLFSGIEQGAQPLFTVAHGEGNKSEMRKLITYTVLTVLIFSAIIYLILYLSTENIVKLFNGENNIEMSKIAVKGIRLYYPATVCTGINIVCATYFSATEKAFRAQVISLLRGVILIVTLAFLCSFLWQTEGVWLSYPITEIIVFFVALILFFIPKIRRQKEKLQINRKFGK